jgi:hypothetical protein
LGQLIVEALVEYRTYVPELVTDNTFAVALSLLHRATAPE